MRVFSPFRVAASVIALLAGVAVALWLIPSGDYIFLPDPADPVAPLVEVAGERSQAASGGGGIYYVSVLVRRATLLERLFPGIREGSSLVPAEQVNPPGVGDRARRKEDLRQMTRSQTVASAVALRALGYKVNVRSTGVRIAAVAPESPAAGKLETSDVVVAVDGEAVREPEDLRRLISVRKPGSRVRLSVRAAEGVRQIELRTVADPREPERARIGVLGEGEADIDLPIRVEIDLDGVGGPSAGLAFALDVLEELGRDVDRGYDVAATGAIRLDGTVEPVGGVKQKVFGARRAGVDVFLVPAGDNAATAQRYAGDLRIIPVRNFAGALRALGTLPPKT